MLVVRNSRLSTLLGAAAVVLGLLAACSGGSSASPAPSSSQPTAGVTQGPGAGQITPTYNELVIDTSASNDGPTLPWSLVKVDRDLNRVYLTASNSDCVFPTKVRVEETTTSITLTVVGVGVGGKTPCTAQAVTMFGYVTPVSPLGDRTIQGQTH